MSSSTIIDNSKMNILYLSLGEFNDLSSGSVHIDIMKSLAKRNNVYLVCKTERKYSKNTSLERIDRISILRVKTGNIKNVNLFEKGVSTLLICQQFKNAIDEYYKGLRFDLVLYETPPITFSPIVKYLKKRDKSKSFLMLKDIFPQNAADLNMIKANGVVYRWFRRKEIDLYKQSDYIGCLSEANINYVIEHNEYLDKSKVGLCPNSIYVEKHVYSVAEKNNTRKKYGIPLDSTVFIYGGNLGKPQGIDFLIKCLETQINNNNYFVIVGKGTEYSRIEAFINDNKPNNIKLIKQLSRNEYEKFVSSCNIGMIFLDYRFTVPNFPARLLSYMKYSLPVLACTDITTDVGRIAVENNFGWWCKSNDVEEFVNIVNNINCYDIISMGNNAFNYLDNNYNVEKICKNIEEIIKYI